MTNAEEGSVAADSLMPGDEILQVCICNWFAKRCGIKAMGYTDLLSKILLFHRSRARVPST